MARAKVSMPLKLTKQRVAGLHAVRAAAVMVRTYGKYSLDELRDLDNGIEWLDRFLALKGRSAR